YLGSGDSTGEGERTTVNQCLADLEIAIDELKDMSGATRVTLVGLRIGAALAALAATERRDVERIVLWDPVVDGETYLGGVRHLKGQWFEDRFGKTGGIVGAAEELMGFPLADDAERQLAGVKILPLPPLRARTGVSLFVSEERADYLALREELAASQ